MNRIIATVETYRMADGNTAKPTSVRLINHSLDSDRAWLIKHMHWALCNGHVVSVLPGTHV